VFSIVWSTSVFAADHSFCTSIGQETTATFPQMQCCACNPVGASIIPADAGVVEEITCNSVNGFGGHNLLETDCSNLPNGMYFYVARTAQTQVSGKFIKQ
jgi:hypothetical protein